MRKIYSKHDEGRKKRRNQWILGGLLIFIMFSGTIGYAFQSFGGDSGEVTEVKKTNFNGFEFSEQNGFWILDFNGENLVFRHNPSQVIGIDSYVNPLLNYEAKPLYVYSEDIYAKSEIKTNLFGFVDVIEDACLEGIENCNNPIKTCDDNFILIRESETREIRQENKCVFISGNGEDLIKLTDEFLYKILGVVQ
jgi:hypothetical protein